MTIFSSDGTMEFKKICVIHLNQIGDLVFSLPLLKALRENNPGAAIHSVIRPYLHDLLAPSPYVDQLIHRKGGWVDGLKLLRQIRQNRYDLLISLSRSIECLMLTNLSKAGVKAGFEHPPWDRGLDIKEKIEGHHSWVNNLKLLGRLNVDVPQKDYVGLLVLPGPADPGKKSEAGWVRPRGKYAVIAAGTSARRRVKAWEERKFGELIVLLKDKYGLDPVLVGSESDREVHRRVTGMIKEADRDHRVGQVFDLSGRISLLDLCYILKDASLFVGVDSGLMHLASALDIPVVGIFGPTDPSYVGPLNARSVAVREEGLDCMPCYLKGCEERACLKNLKVEKVFRSCEQVLDSQR
jgi:ADP-heptose:LPS heptosyltransferase